MIRTFNKPYFSWSPIFLHDYIELRRRHELFQEVVATETGSAWIVLDLGGKDVPYKMHFEGRFATYVAVDLSAEKGVNLISDGHNLAVRDLSVDVVICTQVLEHVKDPFAFIQEIHRILKKGGRLYLTIPAIYPIHGGPYDAWRFLPDGIKILLRAFSKVTVRPEFGTIGTFFWLMNLFILLLGSRLPWVGKTLSMLLIAGSNLVGYSFDRFASAFIPNQQFVGNYFVRAVK
jgi:SAM-dependent methyltransferase